MKNPQRCYTTEHGQTICYSPLLAAVGAIAIAVADIALAVGFTLSGNIFLAVASPGIATFLGILTLADYVSIEPSVSTGEMRSAIASSVVVVYFVVLALAFSGKQPELSTTTALLQNFTWVVGAVVVFYFGSKGVLQYVELTNGVKAKNRELAELRQKVAQ